MGDRPAKILGLCGSPTEGGRTSALVDDVLAAAAAAGATTRHLHLGSLNLPLFAPGRAGGEAVDLLRAAVAEADGILLATPVYHGGPSGVLKNALDWLVDEPAGRLAGIVVTTSRGLAEGCVMQLTALAHSLHMWVLPYAVTVDAGESSVGVDEPDRLTARKRRMGSDLASWAPLLVAQFVNEQAAGQGFAAGHPVLGSHSSG